MRTAAWRADKAGAVSDGWTIWQPAPRRCNGIGSPRNGKACFAALPYAMEVAPVVPAAGFLADIPSDRPLSTELRASHLRSGPGKARVKLFYERTLRYLGEGRQGPILRPPRSSRMPFNSWMLLILTAFPAVKVLSLRHPSRSVPPAWTLASPDERCLIPSSSDGTRTYWKSRYHGLSLLSAFSEDLAKGYGVNGAYRHPYARGIVDCIGNGCGRGDRYGLPEAFAARDVGLVVGSIYGQRRYQGGTSRAVGSL